ncbi:MAG: class I SAM-dependent methyltransferase [Tidjanibacter sp.]|nr:class I SAM-dependent methyltransferase [Tidjanibacter sp.]
MKNPELLFPLWRDYELIDCGDFEKLERYGKYVLRRPEPQAMWRKSLSERKWAQRADAVFSRDAGSEEKGRWQLSPKMPDRWFVEYDCRGSRLKMRLGLTSFKHVGLFPEQAANWDFIHDTVKELAQKSAGTEPKVLNLFAYTGGATLAARAAGADVTHLDSVKQVVNWSNENMTSSGLDGVRWIVDDALKFVRREVKRGRKYNGIILDPPAYGRGPEGEKWVLERNICELLECCAAILEPKNSFLVLNLYSMGLSATLAKSAANRVLPAPKREQFGELCMTDSCDKVLPLGVFYRCVF